MEWASGSSRRRVQGGLIARSGVFAHARPPRTRDPPARASAGPSAGGPSRGSSRHASPPPGPPPRPAALASSGDPPRPRSRRNASERTEGPPAPPWLVSWGSDGAHRRGRRSAPGTPRRSRPPRRRTWIETGERRPREGALSFGVGSPARTQCRLADVVHLHTPEKDRPARYSDGDARRRNSWGGSGVHQHLGCVGPVAPLETPRGALLLARFSPRRAVTTPRESPSRALRGRAEQRARRRAPPVTSRAVSARNSTLSAIFLTRTGHTIVSSGSSSSPSPLQRSARVSKAFFAT